MDIGDEEHVAAGNSRLCCQVYELSAAVLSLVASECPLQRYCLSTDLMQRHWHKATSIMDWMDWMLLPLLQQPWTLQFHWSLVWQVDRYSVLYPSLDWTACCCHLVATPDQAPHVCMAEQYCVCRPCWRSVVQHVKSIGGRASCSVPRHVSHCGAVVAEDTH
jgi:hypothetical protein